MIIDIHTHCFRDELAIKAIPLLSKAAGIPAYTDGTVTCLKKSMEQSGIDFSVIQPIATKPEQTIPINRWAASIRDENIIAFGTLNPDFYNWKEEVEWLASEGFKGVKFHPDYQRFYVDEPRLFPIYEALFKQNMVLIFHAGVDLGLPSPYHCTPSRLRNVLDAFPGTAIIAAHMGGFQYWNQLEDNILGREIYLDTSFSFKSLGSLGMSKIIKDHGADKILFGSDSPWAEQAEQISHIKSLKLPPKEIQGILGGNSKTLLNL